MARDRLVNVCYSRGEQIHLVLGKYLSPLIRFESIAGSFRVSSHIPHHRTQREHSTPFFIIPIIVLNNRHLTK